MCVGNEVEILALQIGSECGPAVFSALTIAKNNGSFQQGGQCLDRLIPRVQAASSLAGLLLSEGTGAVGKQVNGEGLGLGLAGRPPRGLREPQAGRHGSSRD